MMSIFFASSRVRRAGWAIAAAGLAVLVSTTDSVFAQPAPLPPAPLTPNCNFNLVGPVTNLNTLAAPASSVAGALTGAIGNINTIFLTQQGSAFVSAPQNPKPEQPGGGVWARAVGGEANVSSTSSSTGVLTVPANPGANSAITTNCANNQHMTFAGVQVGADIAKLNVNGWNLHSGTTAGYVESRANDNLAGFTTKFQVPFVGVYGVATKDRFFADVMIRQDFYNMRLNDPALGFFDQGTAARGVSVAASAGYNFALANNWFIEPSAGFIWSKTKVDSFNSGGTVNPGIAGINSVDDIDSRIGRLTLRGGTTFTSGNMIWQPFASVSVFHEFAGAVRSNYTSINAVQSAVAGVPPFFAATYSQTTLTSRVGTYGQYSLGIAGQLANTGWLGFVRVDYRNGDHIDGWTGNAGIRYQFTPEMIAGKMPTKIPVKALPPAVTTVNWTGFYVGGFFGADYGTTDVRFPPGNDGNKVWAVGALGGIQAGYNYQVNKWVLGVEGDIGATNLRGSRTCGLGTGIDPVTHFLIPGAFSPAFYTCESKMDWIATATARLGYSWERTLLYVKGGAAFTDERVTTNCITNAPGGNPPCNNPAGVASQGWNAGSGRTGWTIGYGTEFDLGKNWSAKAEYAYIDFGRKTNTANDGTLISDHVTQSQVKIGVNYRFTPGAAVVAKY
jgi:opacity protein-like surface antigen